MFTLTDRIETITTPSIHGIVKDMLGFAQTKGYDAIVVGRRGLSKIQEKLMGSVSRYIISNTANRALWVVS